MSNTKPERQDQADHVTMSGGGVYSLATRGAKDVIDKATPQVLSALDSVLVSQDTSWCFSDMGCADGGTSLDLWRSVIRHLRNDNTSDIQIVYADQARNDFNALVQILHGLTEFESYLTEFNNVHVLQSGSSFYLPILPASSLHLGFSATAMHWLRGKPCDIDEHVHMVGASGQSLAAFRSQAKSDWETILIQRARELKPGGKLVLVNFAINEQGQYLGNTAGVNMFDNFNQNWQQFVDDGVITDQEYLQMTLPQFYHTKEEFSAPLVDETSDVFKAGLRLESIYTDIVECPYAASYKQHNDAQKFAEEYIPTIRTWNESTYMGALSPSRPLQERQDIIENFYRTYQSQVQSNPDAHRMDYVHAYMTISKAG